MADGGTYGYDSEFSMILVKRNDRMMAFRSSAFVK